MSEDPIEAARAAVVEELRGVTEPLKRRRLLGIRAGLAGGDEAKELAMIDMAERPADLFAQAFGKGWLEGLARRRALLGNE